MTDGSALWLHAVTRGLPADRLGGLTGVGGRPVGLVEVDGLAALVCRVPLDEFGEEALTRNLADLDWLARVAREHHALVSAVAAYAPVAPTRLATLYHDEPRVAAVLSERWDDLNQSLDRVTGRTEWGVKAYPGDTPAAAPVTPGGDPEPSSDRPGLAYLRRRRAQLSGIEQAREEAVRAAGEVHGALSRYAEAARRHTPQDRGLAGNAPPMLLNGAYLTADGAGEGFAELVRTLADRYPAVRLELTGPWPPYSFALVEAGEVGS